MRWAGCWTPTRAWFMFDMPTRSCITSRRCSSRRRRESLRLAGCSWSAPLHRTRHTNSAEVVVRRLDAGAQIEADEINCYGGKPLHWASEHAPGAVRVLLERGADVHSRNRKVDSEFFGMTPLIMNATQR